MNHPHTVYTFFQFPTPFPFNNIDFDIPFSIFKPVLLYQHEHDEFGSWVLLDSSSCSTVCGDKEDPLREIQKSYLRELPEPGRGGFGECLRHPIFPKSRA